MTDPEIIKQRMEQGFTRAGNVSADDRVAHALEYVAFYLVRIDRRLEQIVDSLNMIEPRGPRSIKQSLEEIAKGVERIAGDSPRM